MKVQRLPDLNRRHPAGTYATRKATGTYGSGSDGPTDPKVPDSFIAKVWTSMQENPRHTFQILTKRPDRAAALVAEFAVLPNVWLGTSVESDEVLHRLDELREAHAPLLEEERRAVTPAERLDLVDPGWLHRPSLGTALSPHDRPMEAREISAGHRAEQRFERYEADCDGTNKKAAGRTLRGRTFDEMPSYQGISA